MPLTPEEELELQAIDDQLKAVQTAPKEPQPLSTGLSPEEGFDSYEQAKKIMILRKMK